MSCSECLNFMLLPKPLAVVRLLLRKVLKSLPVVVDNFVDPLFADNRRILSFLFMFFFVTKQNSDCLQN